MTRPFCAAKSDALHFPSDAVDIFDVTAGTWSTAKLNLARADFAAASLPNLGIVIFAGGSTFFSFFMKLLQYDFDDFDEGLHA